ncbi:hypothetical protein [Acinetobacter chengduensis]|nr:hypothetical protein [Acinetobacter chengduensis]
MKEIENYFPNMGTKKFADALDNAPLEDFYHEGYHWAGLKKSEIASHYRNLHALGVQQKEYYLVKFSAYQNNATKEIPLIANKLSGWLATSVNWPLLQVDTDAKKAGNYSFNTVTGRQFPEMTLNMIETKDNLVLQSHSMLKNLMFNRDGTFNPPAKYLMWVEFTLFNREKGIARPSTKDSMLCYPSSLSLDVDSTDRGALILPITFARARPFMSQ